MDEKTKEYLNKHKYLKILKKISSMKKKLLKMFIAKEPTE